MRKDEFPLIEAYADSKVNEVLNKIRAEIQAMADIEWNTQVGSVSQGLEDAIEIIDKYKAETEAEDGNDD